MNKSNFSLMVLMSMLLVNTAQAECTKTLMGNDCAPSEKGIAAHMRGNAVENAKASKALKEAKRKAKEKAIAIGKANKKK